MVKKTSQITIHLSDEMATAFKTLADLEGKSASEKGGELIEAFVLKRKRQHDLMHPIFSSKEFSENGEN